MIAQEFVKEAAMDGRGWRDRFFETTRGRIVRMLAAAQRTVSDMAGKLGLTENAVRAQLATLERDGLARQSGTRAAVRKPEYAFDLTAEGHELFPKLYAPALSELVDVLGRRLGAKKAAGLLRDAGTQMIEKHLASVRSLPPPQRLARLTSMLQELGFPVQVEQEHDRVVLRGVSCPLASVVCDHPDLCPLVASLLSDVLGRPVSERCDRSGAPRCCFESPAAPSAGRARRA